MKIMKRLVLKGLVLMMSILLIGAGRAGAESGPFENFFRKMRHAFSEPQHKSARRSSHKQTDETKTSSSEGSNTHATTGGGGAPPSERNTRTATRAPSKKGDDLRYGTPVPGKKGFVTSLFLPYNGLIDVRGFASG